MHAVRRRAPRPRRASSPGPAVLLLAAQRRHDAERAGVVAADADRHPGRCTADSRAVGRVDGNISSDSSDLDLRLRLCRARSSSTGSDPMLCVPNTTSTHGARSTIRPWSFCARQPPTAICMPGLRCFDREQVAEVAVEPVVGVLPHRAGVEHDDVGVVAAARPGRNPPASSRPAEPLRVVHVHLAAVGAHLVRPCGHGPGYGIRRCLLEPEGGLDRQPEQVTAGAGGGPPPVVPGLPADVVAGV